LLRKLRPASAVALLAALVTASTAHAQSPGGPGALRERVGDAAFFSILRDWVTRHRYGNATTQDFVALAEADSGRSLSGFFDVWLYRPGKPTTW
jgi:hypothetical protein